MQHEYLRTTLYITRVVDSGGEEIVYEQPIIYREVGASPLLSGTYSKLDIDATKISFTDVLDTSGVVEYRVNFLHLYQAPPNPSDGRTLNYAYSTLSMDNSSRVDSAPTPVAIREIMATAIEPTYGGAAAAAS
jgi:hypothetical protein